MQATRFIPYKQIKSWQATDKNGRTTTIEHYPTEARLYELATRYPDANFEVEILHIAEEADFVAVRVSLFIGTDYTTSKKKTQDVSQGKLTQMDKVVSKAKARCCRDFGLGTAHALATRPQLSLETRNKLNELYEKFKELKMVENPSKKNFLVFIAETFDPSIESPEDISIEVLDMLAMLLEAQEKQ